MQKLPFRCFQKINKKVLETLAHSEADIKQELSESLRLRRIPKIHYVFDENEAYAADIERALYELKQKGEL